MSRRIWAHHSLEMSSLMAQAAVKYELIKRICSMNRVSITTNLDTHTWYTTNLLHTEVYYEYGTEYDNRFYIPCVDGIKTGYTDMGQRCLLFSFSSEGMDVVGAMLNVPTDDMDEIWNRSYALVSEVIGELCIQYPVDDDNRRCDLQITNRPLFSEKTVTLWAEEDLVFIGEKEFCSEGLEWHLEYDPEFIEVKKNGRLKLLRPLELLLCRVETHASALPPMRLPPRQILRADFPHTAFGLCFSLCLCPFLHR